MMSEFMTPIPHLTTKRVTVEVLDKQLREISRLQEENGFYRAVLGPLRYGMVDGIPCFCPLGHPINKPSQDGTATHTERCTLARTAWKSGQDSGIVPSF